MAANIKGITIEIAGETKGLTRALEGVNKQTKSMQSELKQVERLLKLDPGNTELLAQRQQILAGAVASTSDKLETLKEAARQAQAQLERGEISEAQFRALQREVIQTEQQLQGFERRLSSTGDEARTMSQRMEEASENIGKVGDKIKGVGEKMSVAVTAPIVGLAGASTKLAIDYEAQMSRVQAIAGATGDELENLNKLALDLGASTSYSAKEAAEGMESLASAGFTVGEIMAAMPGLLDLAASSGEELATSSDIAASTLRGFGLAADQAGHVADVLAKNASDTNAAVADTGEAMKYVAPVASAMGLSLEEVTASIGLMANAGIKGSQAGTTLRGALSRLADPSKEASKAMEDIGFKAFDSQGKMLPLKDLIDRLQKSTAGLTDQQKQQTISQIFGQEAMSGMLSLIKAGPEELGKLTESYKSADGAAKEMADTMLNNTKGSVEEMMGSLETAGIKIGQALAPIITEFAKVIGNLADAFSNLSPETQKTILVIAGIAAAIGPALVVIGMLVSAVGTIAGAFAAASGAIAAAGGAIAIITGPIGIAIAVIAALAAAAYLIVSNWEPIKEFFSNLWDSITTTISAAWEGIKKFFTTKVPEIIESIVSFFNELPAKLGYALGFALSTLIKWGIDAVAWAIENVPKIITAIVKFYLELPGKIANALVGAVTALATWASNMIAKAKATIPGIISTIVGFFEELPGKMFDIGVNVVKGLWEGIKSMGGWIKDMVSGFIDGLIAGAKAGLGISSPSKVFAEIGKNISLGMANGIESGANSVQSALNGLTGGSVSVGVNGLSAAGGLSTSNTYTFAPGSIVIPAKDLAEMRTIQDFFNRLPQVARQGV